MLSEVVFRRAIVSIDISCARKSDVAFNDLDDLTELLATL